MSPLSRRNLVRAAVAAPAVAVAGCRASTPTPIQASRAPVPPTASTRDNPFGAPVRSQVDLVLDDTHLPAAFTQTWRKALDEQTARVQLQPSNTREVAAQVLPRLATDSPPDLVLNGGADPVGLAEHAQSLADLSSLLPDGLRPGVRESGTVAGRVVALPTTHVVWGLWYSRALFHSHGWQVPTTLDEMLALGREARRAGVWLLSWGRDTATWLQRMVLCAAVKEGGNPVRLALENLDPTVWTSEPVQAALAAMKQLVDAKVLAPGGSKVPWRNREGAWVQDQKVAMAAGGSWLARGAALADAFDLTVAPDPSLTRNPTLGRHALHAEPGDALLLPAHAANPAGAKEAVRTLLLPATAQATTANSGMLSSLAAPPTHPTSIQQQQLDLLQAAGNAVITLRQLDVYGTNHDHQALWNGFLEGTMDVATLTAESRRITTLVVKDPAQTKFTFA